MALSGLISRCINKLNGYIGISDSGAYSHSFGGNCWTIDDSNPIGLGAHLLLNLDLTDPRLDTLQGTGSRFLPVCSYINCDVWVQPQVYTFDPDRNVVQFVDHSASGYFELPEDMAFENPLPHTSVDLREMTITELILTKDDYWKACDGFLGGKAFLRILGPTLWLQNPDSVACECGRESLYFCSIGYEHLEEYGLFGGRPFFIGEGALYFFICKSCMKVVVKSQSS